MTVTSAEAGLGLRSIYYHKPLRADGHRFVTLIVVRRVGCAPIGAISY